MRRLVNPRQRAGLLQILLILIVTAWCSSANAINVDDFLLLDKTLLLNAEKLPLSSDVSLLSDFGRRELRGELRALGIRQVFGREMKRMGREFALSLRSARGNTFSPLPLTDARALTLRSDVGRRLSILSARKPLQVLSGRYLLGTRTIGKRTNNERELSLFGHFSILDKTLVWTVSDSENNIFAMSNYKSVPEPSSLILLATGFLGLMFMVFYKSRYQR